MNANDLSDLRHKIDRKHEEALAALETLAEYFRESLVDDAGVPPRNGVAAKPTRTYVRRVSTLKNVKERLSTLMGGEWFTTKEAAAILNVSRQEVLDALRDLPFDGKVEVEKQFLNNGPAKQYRLKPLPADPVAVASTNEGTNGEEGGDR
jgi:hypothetical protein